MNTYFAAALAAGAVATAAIVAPAGAQTRLVMAGSSSGGTAHLYFAALAPLLNKYIPNMEASARSGGSSENVVLLERGRVEIAGASPGQAETVLGKEAMEKTRIRTLFAMFHIPYHVMVPKTSPVQDFSGLKGRRVAVGVKAGGDAVLFLKLVDIFGAKPDDYRLEYLGKGEATNAYKDGAVEGIANLCPLPCPLITELATHPRGVRLVSMTGAEVAKVKQWNRWYSEYKIDKSVYANALKDDSKDINSFTEWFYVATHEAFPEETAYQIAKTIGEKHAELLQAFRAAGSSTAANTAEFPGFKLHPGTARYLKEKGLLK